MIYKPRSSQGAFVTYICLAIQDVDISTCCDTDSELGNGETRTSESWSLLLNSLESKTRLRKVQPLGHFQCTSCFCMACELTTACTFFKSLGETIKNNISWRMKITWIQISVCVNKVLLEHSHAHLFIYCVWLLSCCSGRVSTHHRDGKNRKAWNSYPTPDLRDAGTWLKGERASQDVPKGVPGALRRWL